MKFLLANSKDDATVTARNGQDTKRTKPTIRSKNHLSKKWFLKLKYGVGILCSMTGDRRGENENSPARHSATFQRDFSKGSEF